MNVGRLPSHSVEQFVLILLTVHRLDFNGRGIRCQLADQPLPAQAHEGIGTADRLLQQELVVNSRRCSALGPDTRGGDRGLSLQGDLAALSVEDGYVAWVPQASNAGYAANEPI
jgi:hypothetical protein